MPFGCRRCRCTRSQVSARRRGLGVVLGLSSSDGGCRPSKRSSAAASPLSADARPSVGTGGQESIPHQACDASNVAPFVRHAPARVRRRHSQNPGVAWTHGPRHHHDLYPCALLLRRRHAQSAGELAACALLAIHHELVVPCLPRSRCWASVAERDSLLPAALIMRRHQGSHRRDAVSRSPRPGVNFLASPAILSGRVFR